jgi:HAD superfamily hydrolase (TIGR01509 family)
MPYRHLIWDMDGTLFDTYPAINRAMQDTLAEFGVSVPLEEIALLMAETFSHCVETVAARHGLEAAAVEQRYIARSALIPRESQPPFPGVIAVLRRVGAAGGSNIIFTHRGRESLAAFLSFYGMADLFADIATVNDGYPRKPDPAGFLALIDRNRLPREEVLAIGDRALDIQAGQAAGIKTCFFGMEPPGGVTPDFVIAHYDDLPAVLGL